MNMFFFFPTTFHLPSFITVITAFLLAGLGIYEWMNYYLICWFRENCYSHLIYTLSWIHIYQTNYYFFILISFFDFFFLNSIQSGVNYQFIFSNIYFQFVHFLWRSVQWLRFSCKWKFTLIEQISICLFVWDLKAGYVVKKCDLFDVRVVVEFRWTVFQKRKHFIHVPMSCCWILLEDGAVEVLLDEWIRVRLPSDFCSTLQGYPKKTTGRSLYTSGILRNSKLCLDFIEIRYLFNTIRINKTSLEYENPNQVYKLLFMLPCYSYIVPSVHPKEAYNFFPSCFCWPLPVIFDLMNWRLVNRDIYKSDVIKAKRFEV